MPSLVATPTGHAMGDEIDQSNEHTEGEQNIYAIHLSLLAKLDQDDFGYDHETRKFHVRRSLEYRNQDNIIMVWSKGTQVTYEEILTTDTRPKELGQTSTNSKGSKLSQNKTHQYTTFLAKRATRSWKSYNHICSYRTNGSCQYTN